MKNNFLNSFYNILILGLISISGVTTFSAPLASKEPTYVYGFETLPFMEGLVEQKEERVDFDTPAGRIIEIKAVGSVKISDIRAFYNNTLPQLGWKKSSPFKFFREAERLSIEAFRVKNGNGMVIVKFFISPIASVP